MAEEFKKQREFESLFNISAYVTSNIPLDYEQTQKQNKQENNLSLELFSEKSSKFTWKSVWIQGGLVI